jgi:alpha-mannosidase
MYYQYHKEHKEFLTTIRDRIQHSIYKPICDLRVTSWVTPEPVPFSKKQSGKKIKLNKGDKWGKLWDCAWMLIEGKIPQEAKGKQSVILIDVNGEACIFDDNGVPIQGLTTRNSRHVPSLGSPGKCVYNFFKNDIIAGNEHINFWIEAGCNDLFGGFAGGELAECCIAEYSKELQNLFYDFAVLYELMLTLPNDRARYHTILNALTNAAHCMCNYTDAEAIKARTILKPELSKKGAKPASFSVTALGHAHIDLGWTWPIRETIRKGCRTFSTVLSLMDKYPDYIFCASQPQLYQWMKDRYPKLYDKIKKRVAQGRWEPAGVMWVESDVNIPSGESLVRQILYGKKFFKTEFGKDVDICFLPDCFGFTPSLPQLLKKADVNYFLTQKTTWVAFASYPHDVFQWYGIDGSSVLAHLPPFEHYSSSAAPESIVTYEKQFKDKMVCSQTLVLFGQGDGGGGPGIEHLEALKREKDLDGMPIVKQQTMAKFFEQIEKNCGDYATWHGPLDLDRHQGTFTSQAKIKWYNRKLEFALRDLEITAVKAMLKSRSYQYPMDQLNKIWKEMLLYQFHDILPGTSINRVYSEAFARYEKFFVDVNELMKKAYAALYVRSKNNSKLAVNTLSWDRCEWISDGKKWYLAEVPSLSETAIKESDIDKGCEISAGAKQLENEILIVKFADDGSIVSIWDKEKNYEVLEKGMKANRLAIYMDEINRQTPQEREKSYDLTWGYENAWDFPIHYSKAEIEHFKLEKTRAYENGPQAIIEKEYVYNKSILKQKIILTSNSRRIDFQTEVNWLERFKMLRTSFPVDIKTNEARCEVQFGNVKRNTHKNTNWDYAKFESVAHKWVDMSRDDYGVALLNDCKYGHCLFGNTLDIALLRGPGYPNLESDKGIHQFTYSLYPHKGNYIEGQVVRRAYELNVPFNIVNGRKTVQDGSFITINTPGVVIETIKKAEDSNDIIVRLYECHGNKVKCKIELGLNVNHAQLVDLLEEKGKSLKIEDNSIELDFGQFEVHTIKLISPKKGI